MPSFAIGVSASVPDAQCTDAAAVRVAEMALSVSDFCAITAYGALADLTQLNTAEIALQKRALSVVYERATPRERFVIDGHVYA